MFRRILVGVLRRHEWLVCSGRGRVPSSAPMLQVGCHAPRRLAAAGHLPTEVQGFGTPPQKGRHSPLDLKYNRVRDRYLFLVLTGPSRMGKIAFALALVGPDRTVEIALAARGTLDLKKSDPAVNEVVVLDEADPEHIVARKRLMQAGPEDVAVQTSATNPSGAPHTPKH